MSRPRLELADVFRRYGGDFRARCGGSLTALQRKVLAAVEQCRSAALGGFVEQCDGCGHRRVCYRSCRNRHCPKCQGSARDDWLAQRRCELLDCEYFHVVFTLPAEIAEIALQNRRLLYGLLFRAAARSLREIAADPQHLGAAIGFLAVLHTWGANLAYHPHLHCVVPGGGLSPERDRWIGCRPGFFLPVRVLSRRFRTLFLEGLERAFLHGRLRLGGALEPLADPHAFARWLRPLRRCEWVVYAKAPFDGPARVLDYLGRYTHRVAISNERILSIDDGTVRFRWKDYRQQHRWKTMALPAAEFIRRFLLHTLPPRFHRIRHFGLFAGPRRQQQLALCQRLLGMPPATTSDSEPPADCRDRFEALTGRSLRTCPACGRGTMETVEAVPPGSEPPPLDDTS